MKCFIRLGATLELDADQLRRFANGEVSGSELERLIEDGHLTLDGESYMPEGQDVFIKNGVQEQEELSWDLGPRRILLSPLKGVKKNGWLHWLKKKR